MKDFVVKRYQKEDFAVWNEFIAKAKNATFLFDRDFMEYHSDRFEDFSLLIYENEKLVALLPANIFNSTIYSHQGLTYGGLIYLRKTKVEKIESVFECLIAFFKKSKIENFYYKPIPSFYVEEGNTEMDYFLFKEGAILERKEMNLAVNLKVPLHVSKSKLKHFRRVENLGLEIVEEQDFGTFITSVLEPRLLSKFGIKPTHTAEELNFLKKQFSNQIKQFSAYFDGAIVAGITIFEFDAVVKSQYGATTIEGEKLRALDFLFLKLIQKYQKLGKSFFDMGIVGDHSEKGFNSGLLQQKEELGCSVYSQDFYQLTI